MLGNSLTKAVSSILKKEFYRNKVLNVDKRFKHEISKARVYAVKDLDDGSQFLSRVPLTTPKLTVQDLPPPIRKLKAKNYSQLTPEQIQSMQQLRNSEPEKYTRSVLANKFNVSPVFVKVMTSAEKEYYEKLEEKKSEQWNKNGYKKQLIYINRQRRRALW